MRSAALRCGLSTILPSILMTPTSPEAAKAATTRRAHATSSAPGAKLRFDDLDMLGMDDGLGAKAVAARGEAFPLERGEIVDLGEHRVDRDDAGCGRTHQA